MHLINLKNEIGGAFRFCISLFLDLTREGLALKIFEIGEVGNLQKPFPSFQRGKNLFETMRLRRWAMIVPERGRIPVFRALNPKVGELFALAISKPLESISELHDFRVIYCFHLPQKPIADIMQGEP